MPFERSSGFTLIELMTVIVVLGIIAALALPSFKSILDGRRLVAATDNLHAMLHYARSEAIKQNRRVQFQFDTAQWCYGVDDAGLNCDCKDATSCTVAGVEKVVNGSDYSNVAFAADSADALLFEPRQGLPLDSSGDPIATLTFTLSTGNKSRQVIVNPVGLIRVE